MIGLGKIIMGNIMKLSELAFACFLYERFADYDKSYNNFLQKTNSSPDFNIPEHRQALLTWLNKWGCRQFSLEFHELASENVSFWYNKYGASLFHKDSNLWELTESEFALVGDAYESLSNLTAAKRKRNGTTFSVSVGPTGAAKILFALRPKALPPWDEPIRNKLGYDNSRDSYIKYLKQIISILENLDKLCQKNGFQLIDLPTKLGRPNSTVPKLIDEYFWITITNNCSLPEAETFKHWVDWNHL